MKKLRVYEYSRCSTCRKALKYLEDRNIPYETLPIVDRPPTLAELKRMLAHYEGRISRLFNTSGELYREMGLATKLKSLSETEALQLLSRNGKLIKRPFVLGEKIGVVGFKEEEWEALRS